VRRPEGHVQERMREEDFQKKQERLDQVTFAWIQVRTLFFPYAASSQRKETTFDSARSAARLPCVVHRMRDEPT
jgi:hypothetical protein